MSFRAFDEVDLPWTDSGHRHPFQLSSIALLQLLNFITTPDPYHMSTFWTRLSLITSFILTNPFFLCLNRYGIAPKLSMAQGNEQPRIEVLNPCDDGDDQKTPTTILFSNEGEFLAFGKDALQMYAEMLDEEETGLLFQTVSDTFFPSTYLDFLPIVQNALASYGQMCTLDRRPRA